MSNFYLSTKSQINEIARSKKKLVLQAGGEGRRLFPCSSLELPKQFLKINGKSFAQRTIDNFAQIGIDKTDVIIVVSNKHQAEIAKEQASEVGVPPENVWQISPVYKYAGSMVEVGKRLAEIDPETIIINTPSDHHLVPNDSFVNAIYQAIKLAGRQGSAIIGVRTNDLDTVMNCGHAVYNKAGGTCFPIREFIEKPDKSNAIALLEAGNSACNTGINVWRADYLLQYAPKQTKRLSTEKLMRSLNQSMRVVVGDFIWYDCGTLKGLYTSQEKDVNHNVILGDGFTYVNDCYNSLIYTGSDVRLHVAGAKNEAVVFNMVDGKPFLMASELNASQELRKLAENYEQHKYMFNNGFQIGRENNYVFSPNLADMSYGLLDVGDHEVCVRKCPDGVYEAIVCCA